MGFKKRPPVIETIGGLNAPLAHRSPDIPCQVASPQSLTPFLQAVPVYPRQRTIRKHHWTPDLCLENPRAKPGAFEPVEPQNKAEWRRAGNPSRRPRRRGASQSGGRPGCEFAQAKKNFSERECRRNRFYSNGLSPPPPESFLHLRKICLTAALRLCKIALDAGSRACRPSGARRGREKVQDCARAEYSHERL